MNAAYTTTEDIYKKVVLVIGSCVTYEHLHTVAKYIRLFSKKLNTLERKYYHAAIVMWFIQKRKIKKNVNNNEAPNADKERDGTVS